jgi:hypothetical protein
MSCIDSEKESDDDQEDFEISNRKEISYEKIGRKPTNKRKNKGAEVNLDNQDRKRSKNNKTNLEDTIQKWLEKQETRQIEADKRKEEQRLELLQMKQQSDMMLFGLLNNLTNCLSGRSNNQSGSNSGIIIIIFVNFYALQIQIQTLIYTIRYMLCITNPNSNFDLRYTLYVTRYKSKFKLYMLYVTHYILCVQNSNLI